MGASAVACLPFVLGPSLGRPRILRPSRNGPLHPRGHRRRGGLRHEHRRGRPRLRHHRTGRCPLPELTDHGLEVLRLVAEGRNRRALDPTDCPQGTMASTVTPRPQWASWAATAPKPPSSPSARTVRPSPETARWWAPGRPSDGHGTHSALIGRIQDRLTPAPEEPSNRKSLHRALSSSTTQTASGVSAARPEAPGLPRRVELGLSAITGCQRTCGAGQRVGRDGQAR